MAPDVELPDPAADAHTVTAVRSAIRRIGGDGGRAVRRRTVALLAVPVAADTSGTSFAVTGAPAVVAGPARSEVHASPYGVTIPHCAPPSAVEEFLAAHLTGADEINRCLAPKGKLIAVSPTRQLRSPSICRPIGGYTSTRRHENLLAAGRTITSYADGTGAATGDT
ncbi:hypothetical protein ACIQI8_44165 [Streptomyces sp. NPDC092369]|uniref:hypothetical protein n=1 Tax=Streptomyces sp. NPDC092369 TaxID=3366015 RepID=UPI0037FE8BEB